MTIEIRQLVIKAVVETTPPTNRNVGKKEKSQIDTAEIVARCTHSVLQVLEQMNER
jgi:hypothetical protein